ncbi:hypothetical protein HNQ60_003874 [Povalibacter uvarum]|uniref:Uncharacterized protein n=1 Tax=Povalibacter uvarum TaxID=732238 RepID=A0A841HPB6_9GAMM|nr:hypothetical protein [Povalibacter uvarum]
MDVRHGSQLPRNRRYLYDGGPVVTSSLMRRVLLSLLLAWVALAPVVANACAVQCEMHPGAMQHQQEARDGMDCHGSEAPDEGSGSSGTFNGMMAAGCFLAATASVPSSIVVLSNVEPVSERPTSLFLLPSSVSSAPPDKPPRA